LSSLPPFFPEMANFHSKKSRERGRRRRSRGGRKEERRRQRVWVGLYLYAFHANSDRPHRCLGTNLLLNAIS
jgi:hypothetical protein